MTEKKIVRNMQDVENAVRDMREVMAKTPEADSPRQLEISAFKKKHPDAIFLEPRHRIPTKGVKHPEKEKERDYLHERVVGIFESQFVGQKLGFWLTGLPGDDFCMWEIPVNKAVVIPRYVAKHLSEDLKWKEMKPLGRDNPPQDFYEGEEYLPFTRFEEKRRGAFHPINAY